MKIVIASNNQGKLREIRSVLQSDDYELVSQDEFAVTEIAETGLTFVENAILKARHAAQQTGYPALADDSGLCVAALNGKPGIYSARYADEKASDQENITKLLTELGSTPQRSATFHCVIVLLAHASDPVPLICQGHWSGEILFSPRGNNGFGYDPIFYLPQLQCSVAELDSKMKNQLSHRAQALKQLQASGVWTRL